MADHDQGDLARPSGWQRLSPIAILYFAASSVKNLASSLIYLVPAVAVSYSSVKDSPLTWSLIALSILAFFVIKAALDYLFFRFKVSADNIEIRSGILAKKHLNLPFNRIQNVTLEQPLYYRMHNVVCVLLDTAGSAQQEAKIIALPKDFAIRLKQQVVDENQLTSARHSRQTIDCVENDNHEVVLNKRSVKDLMVHGVTNNRVWIILGFLAPVYDDIAAYISTSLNSMGVDYQSYFDTQTQATWQLSLAFLGVVATIFLLVTMVSVLGSIVMFYDFTLNKTVDRYVRRSGLFTKQETTMRLSRIQVISLKQDWLDVLLKRINLELKQNSSGAQAQNEAHSNSKILVPSIRPNQATELVADAFPENNLRNIRFHPISRRFIVRQCLVWLIPICTLAVAFTLFNFSISALLPVVLLTLLLFVAICCRWKRWGYAKDNEFVYIRKGMFGVDYYCFPIYKVQQTRYSQSYFMAKQQLAQMQFVLASGLLYVPFVKERVAKNWLNETLTQVSQHPRSWM